MKVLIACEFSQVVTKAFRARGHTAYSCDLLDCEGGHPEWHFKKDVFEAISSQKWDLMIAHPPCTYLCVSGIHWNNRGRGWDNTYKAIDFVKALFNADIPRIAIENPIGVLSSHIGKPNQIVRPYNFGHDAAKSTCLWLKNLPKLEHTDYIPPRIINGKKRWSNQCENGGQDKLGPSKDRWKIRSITYQGIADAFAEQWGIL